MAYMNQERKTVIAAALKKIMPEGWKYSLSVRNHSTIVFTLRQAPVDIIGHITQVLAENGSPSKPDPVKAYWGVNVYYLDTQFSGAILNEFKNINDVLNAGNHDNSDIQTDYFDVGWYVDIKIGDWNNPFLDTVPLLNRPAKEAKALTQWPYPSTVLKDKKPALSEYAQFLPAGWKTMTPGKKAAATKRAMACIALA